MNDNERRMMRREAMRNKNKTDFGAKEVQTNYRLMSDVDEGTGMGDDNNSLKQPLIDDIDVQTPRIKNNTGSGCCCLLELFFTLGLIIGGSFCVALGKNDTVKAIGGISILVGICIAAYAIGSNSPCMKDTTIAKENDQTFSP